MFSSQSSISSSLNSLSAVTWKDLIEPHLKIMIKEATKAFFIKVLGMPFLYVCYNLPQKTASNKLNHRIAAVVLCSLRCDNTFSDKDCSSLFCHEPFLNSK